MTACQQAHEWIQARLDGQLGASQDEQLRAHLAACAACRARAGAYERLFGALDQPARREPPQGFVQGVMARLAAAEARRRRWQAWVTAAGVAAAAGLGLLLFGAPMATMELGWLADLGTVELWRGLWPPIAEAAAGAADTASAWVAHVPGGAALALALLALAAVDAALAYRWRALARLNGREGTGTMR